ncbi:acyl-CoA dehydrogenase family protein [Amycolatopsis sp. QT-25]|uniref:acyl-CoA dehydrogenase family protein n=1 Tax=Amycolatopsis sp. QT-25 TaxID=3034022 RepID=UPI0023EAFB3B|nr:acyl-CoA dehydrogenase family protein [Amycolatopsis sp. QT-25]WET81658.1 acyl-CoA dehydrogenase family protein [Amycolatopsis sp. QT-25]
MRHDPEADRFRSQVRALLRIPEPAAPRPAPRHRARTETSTHDRRIYTALGARGWLAPHWPPAWGGQGSGWSHSAVVAEELALHGVSDTALVNTVYNFGECLRRIGTPGQQADHLPRIAAGELVAAVLFTEPGAGSDLATLTTTATRRDGGWVLSGTKTWSAQTDLAELALCAARTSGDNGRGPGITLFLVPLDTAGVRVEPLHTINPEPLHQVLLDQVELTDHAVIGAVGGAWPTISHLLSVERASLGYHGRARRWFGALLDRCRATGALADPAVTARLSTLDTDLAAAGELAWRAVYDLDETGATGVAAAVSKWRNTELGAEIVRYYFELDGMGAVLTGGLSEVAFRESAGLTLAAGTSEVMLTLAGTHLRDLLDEAG